MKSNTPLIIKYLQAKAVRKHLPLTGTFELSPCCNMDCRMCYVRKTRKEVEKSGGEISPQKWLEMGKTCRDAGMLFILLTGGEPFLYQGFREVYTGLKKMGLLVSINSNGTMIDESVLEWLKEDPPTRINMTLYGGSNETYERLCRNPNGFDQAIEAAKRIKNAGIDIHFNASMTPYNKDDLEDIFRIGQELGIRVRASSYMFPPMRKDESLIGCGDRITAEEAGAYTAKIDQLRLLPEEFLQRARAMRDNKLLFSENECDIEIEKGEKEPLRCQAGRSAFWINWKGEMSPCGMMTQPVTFPFKDGFKKAWDQLLIETEKLYMPPKCKKCKKKDICSVCGASSFTETGVYGEVPEYICEMTDSLLRHTEEILKEIEKKDKIDNKKGKDSGNREDLVNRG